MIAPTTQQLTNDHGIWSQHRYCVVDYEGTGLQFKDEERVVEVAALRIGEGEIARERFVELIDPEVPIPPAATRIHGISDAMVQGKPNFGEILPKLQLFLGDAILVAHNARVEQRMLERLVPGYVPPLIIDTLKLSRSICAGETSHSLPKIVERFGLMPTVDSDAPGVSYHRAEYDALATAFIFLRLLESAGKGSMLTTARLAALGNILETSAQQALF